MKHFSEIIKDNRSGSVRIVNNLIKELSAIIETDAPEGSRGNLDNSVIEDLKKVLYHHRGMLVLFHFINEFLLKIDEDYSKNSLILFLNDYKDKWENVNKRIIENILKENDLNGKKIFLHSNSSTVIELFREFYSRDIYPEVYQTVSYPVEEGKIQAEEISRTGVKINVIADGAAADIIRETDFFICGADAILKDGFVNKSGTFLYSLACSYFRKDIFILTDSRKIINEDYLPLKLRKLYTGFTGNSPAEIWKDPPENITVINRYFENTPLKFVRKVYTEKEILLPSDILNRSTVRAISTHLL